MGIVRTAVLWSFVTQYGQMITTFITSVILARLLTPAEIGVFSIAMIIVGFGRLLRDFGISDYIVQEVDLTDQKIRTAQTLNFATGWIVGIALFLFAGDIGEIYGEPAAAEIIRILSINFVFVPMGAITFARLRRDLRFKETTQIQIGAIFLTSIVSISMALGGYGANSMAYGTIAGAVVTAVACQFFRYANGFGFSLGDLKSVWGYSSNSIAFSSLRYFTQSLPELLLGRYLGMHDVGIFSKGRSTVRLAYQSVVGGIKPVMMPAFAKDRAEPGKLEQGYLDAISASIVFVWPAVAYCSLMAEEIVLLLFGEQWLQSAQVMRVAAIGTLAWSAATFSEDLLKGTGRIKLLFRLELILLPTIAVISYVFAPGGAVSLAMGLAGFGVFRFLLSSTTVRLIFGFSTTALLRVLTRGLVCTAMPLLAAALVANFVQEMGGVLLLIVTGLAFSICWALLMKLMGDKYFLALLGLALRYVQSDRA